MPRSFAGPVVARVAAASLVAALLASLVPLVSVSAAVGITGATGGASISADTNPAGSGAYTTLVGPVIQEGAAGDLVVGSFHLKPPTGFEYQLSSASATLNAGCTGMTLGSVTTTASDLVIPVSTISTGSGCTITVSGLGVRPTAGNPLASPGNITNTTGTTGPTGGNYGHLEEVAGAPTLDFNGANIGNSTGGVTITNPQFHDDDAWGNNRQGDSVTLAVKPGTGTAGATVTCATNPKNTDAAGLVVFTMCSIDKAGIGYQLRASTGAAVADTNTFNISVGPASKLVFTSYPAATTPSILTPQPAVSVTDAGGNVITTDNSTVVTIAISSNTGTFSCTGGLAKTVSAGTATYTGCQQTSMGTYTLSTTSSPPHGTTTGATFDVTSGTASKLALCWGTALACPQTPPAPINGGTTFSTQPTIRVQDAAGNTVASDNTTVITLAIASGTPSSGGPGTLTCSGGNTKTVTAGVATFAGCSIDKAGTGYRLTATSAPALTSATSNLFNVVAGTASKLTFVVQPPATTAAGSPFATAVQVAITDAGGNIITSGISATIALALGNNPGAAALACTGGNSANTVNGVAVFNGCTVSAAGVGYTLTATAIATAPVTPLAPATSTPFNVNAQAAAISLTSVPSSGVIVWGQDVTFNIHFAVNGAGKTFSLQVSKDGTTWSTIGGAGALVTNASGDATFLYGPSDNRYYRAVFAGTPDLSAGNSPTLRVVVRQTNQLRPTNNGKIKTISHNTTISFKSTIRPNRPELPQARANFVVYQLVGGAWIRIANVIVGVDRSNGVATFNRSFTSIGRFYVRSQAVPTQFNANSGWSPVEQYIVV